MTDTKLEFLRNEYLVLLTSIPEEQKGIFGKMNPRQMIEHMTWSFQIANGKVKFENKNSPDMTARMHRFMMSEKPFKNNTPNSNLPDNPLPIQTDSQIEAINQLSLEIENMVEVYSANPALRIENPFFGMLNFSEQVQLLHKHALHHLRQFEALPK